jgi:hypothetical protein
MRARDQCGMTEDRGLVWSLDRRQNMPVCSPFGVGFAAHLPPANRRPEPARSRRSSAPRPTTEHLICRMFSNGSDGTRTRDLRRDTGGHHARGSCAPVDAVWSGLYRNSRDPTLPEERLLSAGISATKRNTPSMNLTCARGLGSLGSHARSTCKSCLLLVARAAVRQ